MPESLVEKYRPRKIEDFIGLEKPKQILTNFVADPMPSSWLFVGASGTGKTAMARVVLELVTQPESTHESTYESIFISSDFHHTSYIYYVPAQRCTKEKVEEIVEFTHYSLGSRKVYGVLVDEADSMSVQAQDAFLSVLDGSRHVGPTVFIFTCNVAYDEEKKIHVPKGLDDRFRTRLQCLDFTVYGHAKAIAAKLEEIWNRETDHGNPRPKFIQIVRDAKNNVRDALLRLQSEIMMRPKPVGN